LNTEHTSIDVYC